MKMHITKSLTISLALAMSAAVMPAKAQTLATPEIKESWEFLLDDRQWLLALQGSFHDHTMRQYVVKGENAQRFSEMVITTRYTKAPADTIDQYLQGVVEESCVATKLAVLEKTDDSVIYERSQPAPCGPYPVQTEIIKMIIKNGAAVSFTYLKKLPALPTLLRNQWVELVKFATPK